MSKRGMSLVAAAVAFLVALLAAVLVPEPAQANVDDGVAVAPTFTAGQVVTPVPVTGLAAFATTGWQPRRLTAGDLPYLRGSGVSIPDPGVHDAGGVRMIAVKGVLYDHPVAQASYGIDLLESYRTTKNQAYLDRAVAQADRLISRRVLRGPAWYYPYPFDFRLHGMATETMKAPWYSGMAQGVALSLFVRLAQLTGDAKWRTAANATFASFSQGPVAKGPWVSRVDHGALWIEEYPRWPAATSDRTINGYLFAVMGIYEYQQLTGSATARKLWDGALTTLLPVLAKGAFLPKDVSKYCLRHGTPSVKYHEIVISQMGFLERETGSGRFGHLMDQYTDAYPPSLTSLRVQVAAGSVTGYQYSKTGAVQRSKTVKLAAATEMTADSRQRVVGGPIAYHLTGGPLAGWYLPEVAGKAYALGRFAPLSYTPERTAKIAAGTLAATKLSDAGASLATTRYTFAAVTSVRFDSSVVVNARRWWHLTTGPLAGYWVTGGSVTTD